LKQAACERADMWTTDSSDLEEDEWQDNWD
jgi:hypothetical protein